MLYTEFKLEDAIAVARKESREDGLAEGIEKGQEEAKAVIAKNLLSKGSTPEFVREITGLELEAINKLRG